MSSALFATKQDSIMLYKALVAHPSVSIGAMPNRAGADVAAELAGRALLRYVDIARFHEKGSSGKVFVTPTPYSPEDLLSALALPAPHLLRSYALWLDPALIDVIKGPRWVLGGTGIEYLLPNGYPERAIMPPGWGVEVR